MPSLVTANTSPYKLVYYSLKLSGLINQEGRPFSLLYSFLQGVMLTILTSLCFGKFIETINGDGNVIEIILSLSATAICIQLYSKLFKILGNEKRILALLSRLDDYRLELLNDERYKSEAIKVDRSTILAIKCTGAFFLSYPIALVLLNFIPDYLTNFEDPKLTHQLWYPWSMHELWRNLAGTILTCLACYTALTIYTAFSSFLIAFSFQISAYSKMLQNRLETNGPQDKTIYRHHQTIIKLVEEFNDLFSIQICIEVLVASLEPCGYGYAMMKSVKKYDLGTLDLFYKMFMVLAAPFALCYCGQVISNQMEKLHDSCYMTNWYEEKPKIRRDLLTMMMVTTKPKTLNYRMIVTFNLQYFFTILQGIYSYLTMIANVET